MGERFLRRAAVEQATGLKRSAIYDLMARGQFPKPIRITDGRAVAWLESEIAAYQNAQIAKARKVG